MHLRRAMLLFAIVLLVGALAASMAPPPQTRDAATTETAEEPAPATAGERREGSSIRFDAAGEPRAARVAAGQHVIATVVSPEPGLAEIAALGLVSPVTPAAPAVFDLFPDRPGRYEVLFRPTGADRARSAGMLVVGR